MNHVKLARCFRVEKPGRFHLRDFDPAETAGFTKDRAEAILAEHTPRLTDLQERLYAENSWAVLIILQGIDAAGKDGAIKHVMAGLNPQGCIVHPFKVPTTDELDHDYLWRAAARLPPRGDIAIFNRSYYEEVLVVRVTRICSRSSGCRRSLSPGASGRSGSPTSTISNATSRVTARW